MGKKISLRPTRAIRQKIQWDRKFLGKLSNFENEEEAKMEAKHLKAYLRGYPSFKWGTREITNPLTGLIETVPNLIPVKQELFIKNQ